MNRRSEQIIKTICLWYGLTTYGSFRIELKCRKCGRTVEARPDLPNKVKTGQEKGCLRY